MKNERIGESAPSDNLDMKAIDHIIASAAGRHGRFPCYHLSCRNVRYARKAEVVIYCKTAALRLPTLRNVIRKRKTSPKVQN